MFIGIKIHKSFQICTEEEEPETLNVLVFFNLSCVNCLDNYDSASLPPFLCWKGDERISCHS